MTGEKYACVCTTCEASEVRCGLRRAQAFFNEHAAGGCEVVLRNLSSSVGPVTAGATRSDTTAEESRSAKE